MGREAWVFQASASSPLGSPFLCSRPSYFTIPPLLSSLAFLPTQLGNSFSMQAPSINSCWGHETICASHPQTCESDETMATLPSRLGVKIQFQPWKDSGKFSLAKIVLCVVGFAKLWRTGRKASLRKTKHRRVRVPGRKAAASKRRPSLKGAHVSEHF